MLVVTRGETGLCLPKNGRLVEIPMANSRVQIDQGDTEFRTLAAAQVTGRFHQGDFERRPNDAFEQMSAPGGAVAQSSTAWT